MPGLWQFVPATGRSFNLRQTRFYDGRRDITASTTAAMDYLTRLHDMFNGDWLLALAAYNAGEGTVSRAIERNEKLGLPTDYWNLPLPSETQAYVPKLLALSQVVMTPRPMASTSIPSPTNPTSRWWRSTSAWTCPRSRRWPTSTRTSCSSSTRRSSSA